MQLKFPAKRKSVLSPRFTALTEEPLPIYIRACESKIAIRYVKMLPDKFCRIRD